MLAWRLGFKGASILLTELDAEMRPGRTWHLDLKHRLCQFGREDPRLFIFRDRLHVSFTGVAGAMYGVLYAEIDERDGEFSAGRVWAPDYASREAKEKNWTFFEEFGRLYAIYSFSPFTILSIDRSTATKIREHAWTSPWQGGIMRGGASPVWVAEKNEWYAFFHGLDPRDRRYTVGAMTFDATFQPKRSTRWPLIVPSNADRPASEGNSAWYVCGAIRDGEDWLISGGVHNHLVEIRRYRASDIEAALETIP